MRWASIGWTVGKSTSLFHDKRLKFSILSIGATLGACLAIKEPNAVKEPKARRTIVFVGDGSV
jgi:TPP-dependent 2-oxoacid decarboxylase